jgi:hypothetical protein
VRNYTEKAQTFADRITSVFKPHLSDILPGEEEALTLQLEIPYQLEPPLSRFHRSEVQTIINNLKPTTSSRAKSFRNYFSQESNISHRYSMLHAHRILPCTMESSKDYPTLEIWQTPNEPMSYSPISLLPILREAPLTPPPPNY